MQQIEAFHDSLEDALKHVLQAVYGKGWQTKAAADMHGSCDDVIQKGKWLENALRPERAEKLSLSEVMWILKRGREHNAHEAMAFITDETSYQRPVPVTPEDRRAELRDEITTATQVLADAVKRLEQLSEG